MARVMFDPENERRQPVTFGRVEMRSDALRLKQARAMAERRRVDAIAAAERDRKSRESQLATLSERATAARIELRQKQSAMREQAVAESMAEMEAMIRRKIRSKQALRVAIIEYRALRLFRITKAELQSPGRTRNLAFARQFVMYWSARLTGLSWAQLASKVGLKDHSTAFYGARAYVDKRKAMGRTLRAAR